MCSRHPHCCSLVIISTGLCVAKMSASCFQARKKLFVAKGVWKSVLQRRPDDLDFVPLLNEAMDGDLRCSVCHGWLKGPVVLPCPAQHMLCQACLERQPKRVDASTDEMPVEAAPEAGKPPCANKAASSAAANQTRLPVLLPIQCFSKPTDSPDPLFRPATHKRVTPEACIPAKLEATPLPQAISFIPVALGGTGQPAPRMPDQAKPTKTRRFQMPTRMRRAAVSFASSLASRVLSTAMCRCQNGAVHMPKAVTSAEDSGSRARGQEAASFQAPSKATQTATNSSVPRRASSSKSSRSIRSSRSGKEVQRILDLEPILKGLLVPSQSVSSATLPSEENVMSVLFQAQKLVMLQPMLLELESPLRVLGDIHGQFSDLLCMLEMGGMPPQANYLLLGDYVDRGQQSLETIVLLLAIKLKYPENFFLLRGNHECASVNRTYGFYDECKRRYNLKMWKKFTDLFNCLPVAALINSRIFCCHGGLSPELNSFKDVNRLQRPVDVPDEGLLCDLLWADPDKNFDGWNENDRGVSYVFGPDVVASFTKEHDLDLIVRAHQVVEDGYEFFADRKVVTVFSAPNYLGEFDNDAAMLEIKEDMYCTFHLLRAK
mmetsp:Transcript_126451/g.219235  ORF Transcript_126451/g.219235 Transcript_126451/m.219235 type:complete len:603 (+) Transcript_126451:3-1811(+)